MGTLKDVIGGMIMLILIYLLVNNASGTNTLIGTVGTQVTDLTKALQGRS